MCSTLHVWYCVQPYTYIYKSHEGSAVDKSIASRIYSANSSSLKLQLYPNTT
jgi:hypothetical protein